MQPTGRLKMPLDVRLAVQVYDPTSTTPWPRTPAGNQGADPAEWSTDLVVAPRRPAKVIEPITGPIDRQEPTLARFANGIVLHGASHEPAPFDGPRVVLTGGPDEHCTRIFANPRAPWGLAREVLWRTSAPISEDLSLFVHLLDGAGRVAQFDGPPATYGRFPTTLWRPGEPVVAVLPWPTGSARADGGPYRVVAGLYRPTTGERIPAHGPDGERLPDDAVPIMLIDSASCGS